MPRKTETAVKPRPSKPKTSAPKSARGSARGRPTTYDWSSIRREYIRGEDDVTFEMLDHKTENPTPCTIENRAARKNWTSLRRDFRDQVMTRTREINADLKAEVRGHHAKIGKAVTALGIRGLAHRKPESMESIDMARFLKIGTEIERRALGMEKVTMHLGHIRFPDDLDKLSEADLWQIAGMLPKDDDR